MFSILLNQLFFYVLGKDKLDKSKFIYIQNWIHNAIYIIYFNN